jgi:high-affinity iron transporter
MILIRGFTALILAAGAFSATAHAADDPVALAKRIAAASSLAAAEYRIGVRDGKVVADAEVEEARLFLTEAKRSASLLPAAAGAPAVARLEQLLALVDRTGAPDSLDVGVRTLAADLSIALGVSLEETPKQTPSLARGAEVYQQQCSSCHGLAGRGDGPAAAGLTPTPSNLADHAALADVTPLDFYRRVTIGVAGTAMPAFEARLSAEDRWAAAAYATMLRYPSAKGTVPAAFADFAAHAKVNDAALLAAIGAQADERGLSQLAAIRRNGADERQTVDATAVFTVVRAQLDSAVALAAGSRGEAASAKAFDAYMTFEAVEREVRAKNPSLADELEAGFASLRTRAQGGATQDELGAIRGQLQTALERAERTVGDALSPMNLFLQSFFLMLREGVEAILIVGALITFLVKTGAGERKRDIHVGVGAALFASVLTAVALETVISLAPAQREALEGGTMVLATVFLFYVSYWLLSKMEVVKWTNFVKSRVGDAVSSGSALALASAAFLAVYREGFETVLFYKALFVAGGEGGSISAVFAGMGLGALALTGVYVAINKFGVRLPLKPFFAATSAFLYYMAFVFAGKGIMELQEGGVVPTTLLTWAPRIPALGIYPTLESLALQGVLAGLAVVALVWTFVIEPRREATRVAGLTPVLVPEPAPSAARAAAAIETARAAVTEVVPAVTAALPQTAQRDLLRSLERMEADLAAMRAEVERMRGYLVPGTPVPSDQSR